MFFKKFLAIFSRSSAHGQDSGKDEALRVEPVLSGREVKGSVKKSRLACRRVKRSCRETEGETLSVLELSEMHYRLGCRCRDGDSLPKSEAEAVKWFRKAADQGHAPAAFSLGVCLASGKGLARDEKRAADCFRKAAEKGYAPAQYRLGCALFQAEDKTESLRWLRRTADQGFPEAQKALGEMVGPNPAFDEKPRSVPEKSVVEKPAAERKRPTERPAVQKNVVERSVAEPDPIDAGAGEDVVLPKQEPEDMAALRRAAQAGDAFAQAHLGFCLYVGLEGIQNEAEAVAWFRKAALLGHAGAQNNLGFCLRSGSGVGADEEEAVGWFRKAAALGLPAAQYDLGCSLWDGVGALRDPARAGCAPAQYALGDCYQNGCGVARSCKTALGWYRKAARQGNLSAYEKLRSLHVDDDAYPEKESVLDEMSSWVRTPSGRA